MMFRTLLTASAVAGALVLAGCESTGSTTAPANMQGVAPGMLNTTCPMSGEPVDPNAKTVSYAGHTIGFCCDGCAKPWAAKTDAEKSVYVSQMTE